MRLPAWLLLGLLLLFAVPALAQQGALRLTLEPASGSAQPGGDATTRLVVTNADPLRPMIVQLRATGEATIEISPAQLQVLPGQTATANATITLPANASAGERAITFFATALSGGNATATYVLSTSAPSAGPGAPTDPPAPAPSAPRATADEGSAPVQAAPLQDPTTPAPRAEPSPGAPREVLRPWARGIPLSGAPPVALSTVRVEHPSDAAPWLAIAGAAVGSAALVVAWVRRRHAALVVALYTRLRPGAVVGQPTRAALLALVARQPGVAVSDAQRELGLANGAMAHHVRVLARARCVRVVADGSRRRLYPTGAPCAAPVAPLGERVLAALAGRGAVARKDLAAQLGVSRQALDYHLRSHEAQGRVVLDRKLVSLRG